MRRKAIRLIVLGGLLLAVGSHNSLFGKEIHSKAGTSAFPFLKINVGARAVSMGAAFTGLADDESALYYNPAGIAALEESRWIAGYHNHFVDIQSGFLGIMTPLNPDNSVALHFSYLDYGELIETDTLGRTLGSFGGGDLLVAGTFARRMTMNIKAGLTAKFIYQSLHDYSSTGFAFDVGAKYTDNRERFTAGLMIQNLGWQLSALDAQKYRLPLMFKSGVSYRPRGMPLLLASDLVIPVDNDPVIALGGEYHEFKPFYLRMGWNSFGTNYRAADSEDKWAGFAVGVGFDVKEIHVAYAYAPTAELGEYHRFTITGGL